MTARIWNGKTKIEHSEMYTKTIEERDIPDYKKTEGFITFRHAPKDVD